MQDTHAPDRPAATALAAGDAGAGSAAREEPSAADWAALAATRVYFGHQSVGENVLDGVRELVATGRAPALSIVRSRAPRSVAGPALVEFPIGENGDPESKARDFLDVLGQTGDSARGIALFKYCFLDVTAATDVPRLFARHREHVRELRASHPELTVVHVTAPLTVDEPPSKRLVKQLLGRPTSRDANRRRNELNALLRAEYRDEPLFDLARVESTRPDGSRSFFVARGDTVYTLAPELTDDGGHLNALGRRAAAAELLRVLARASRPTPVALGEPRAPAARR